MVVFFRYFIAINIFFTFLPFAFEARGDRVHAPSYVFEDHLSGRKALNPVRATNAAFCHLNSIKGRTKTGKRLLAAVLDYSINSNLHHMRNLKRQGLIHPAALKPNNPYMVNPEEDFDKYEKIENELREKYWDLFGKEMWAESAEEKLLLKQQLQEVEASREANQKKVEEIRPRKWRWEWNNQQDACNHGAGVIHALHKIAPEASILPIDLSVMSLQKKNNIELTSTEALSRGIREAIYHKVDVINLSLKLIDLDQDGLEAMAEAVQKGITIVNSAGNDSFPGIMYRIREAYDNVKGLFVKSTKQKLFEKLKGKGIIFAGSTGVDPFGKETVSDYSQHPEEDTRRNFILAPGEHLNIQANNNPRELVCGTSFSSPVIAGAFLNLKQYCLDKGYKVTQEDLINMLHESGQDIVYEGGWLYGNKTYKSLDVWKACQYADQKFNPKPIPTVTKKLPPKEVRPHKKSVVVKKTLPTKTLKKIVVSKRANTAKPSIPPKKLATPKKITKKTKPKAAPKRLIVRKKATKKTKPKAVTTRAINNKKAVKRSRSKTTLKRTATPKKAALRKSQRKNRALKRAQRSTRKKKK
ncbi:MAG: S8 family serine peptidase [Alphaproteobacteria bacterium]|nr:S8 family serine peptidase [Alphaproteobacteria bacterium]